MLIMTILLPSLRPWWVMMVPLPETNKSPPKIGLPNRKIVFQPSISKGRAVSWREGKLCRYVCSQECGRDNRPLEAQRPSPDWSFDGLRRSSCNGWEIRQKPPRNNHPAMEEKLKMWPFFAAISTLPNESNVFKEVKVRQGRRFRTSFNCHQLVWTDLPPIPNIQDGVTASHPGGDNSHCFSQSFFKQLH